jgi:hypothetical protein
MLAVRMCGNILSELVFMVVYYCYHLAHYLPLILQGPLNEKPPATNGWLSWNDHTQEFC